MTRIISTHSFRGGTGKSNLTANMAAHLARLGNRVGIVDGDIQSPGIHIIFGLDVDGLNQTLNHYLWGQCTIEEAAHRVYSDPTSGGEIHLVPASIKPNDIARILREKYDANDMHTAFRDLNTALRLDYLLIDTHPGLNEETLLSIAISDALVIVLRPDQQDFQGTSVTVDIARRLRVPAIHLVVNKIPDRFSPEDVKQKVEEIYGAPVAALLPLSLSVANNGSGSVFLFDNDDHPFSRGVQQIVQALKAGEAEHAQA